MDNVKARIFISCGQATQSERWAADAIAGELRELGYDPYVAVQERSLRGLKENIFARLGESEYFLFLDFRREQLQGSAEYRGSLFSHQELAIASYLDLQFMGFRQDGVKLEGVLSFLQGNCVTFKSPKDLPLLVRQEIKRLGWRSNWQNKLQMTRYPEEYSELPIGGDPKHLARWFHIKVTNVSKFRTAVGCRAYIGHMVQLEPNSTLESLGVGKAVELKWGGYTFPDVIIPPNRSRDLDSGYILQKEPNVMRFTSFSDSSDYQTFLRGPGKFVVSFVLISENFPEIELPIKVTLGTSLDAARVQPMLDKGWSG